LGLAPAIKECDQKTQPAEENGGGLGKGEWWTGIKKDQVV